MDKKRPAGIGGGPSLVDTGEVDDGWGEEEEDVPAAPAEAPPPSSGRPLPPPRSTRPAPVTDQSSSAGEAIAVDTDYVDAGVLVSPVAAPSATPSAPTAADPDSPTMPLDAQATTPMPAMALGQAAPSPALVGEEAAPSYPTAVVPDVAGPPPAALGSYPQGAVPAAVPAAGPAPAPAAPPATVGSARALRLGPIEGALAVVVVALLASGWLVAAALWLLPIVAPRPTAPLEATGVATAASVNVQAVAAHRRAQQELATAGDSDALSKLAALRPGERTAEQALALARGRLAEKLGELQAVERQIQANAELAKDPKVLGKLHRQAYDAQLSQEALRVMAGLPGEAGADLLYAVWTHTTQRTPATTLARDLLLSREVADKVSPALRVVLDLRAAEDCETRQKLLAAAQEHGDARALRQLNLLKLKTGCGPNKMADCHPCLRAGTALDGAIKAVVARRPPRY